MPTSLFTWPQPPLTCFCVWSLRRWMSCSQCCTRSWSWRHTTFWWRPPRTPTLRRPTYNRWSPTMWSLSACGATSPRTPGKRTSGPGLRVWHCPKQLFSTMIIRKRLKRCSDCCLHASQHEVWTTKHNWSTWCQYNVTGWGSMWASDMLSQWGSTIKRALSLTATNRHKSAKSITLRQCGKSSVMSWRNVKLIPQTNKTVWKVLFRALWISDCNNKQCAANKSHDSCKD